MPVTQPPIHFQAGGTGNIVGDLHPFPWDDFENDIRNPLVPEERYLIESPFLEIDAIRTYYIHALSVFPEFARQGIGSLLLELEIRLEFYNLLNLTHYLIQANSYLYNFTKWE